MISANGVEYKNLPEQVQYLTEKAAEFAVELDRVSASVDSVAGDVAALQTSYTALAEDVRVAKININSLFTNVGTAFSEIANIKNGNTPLFETITDRHGNKRFIEGNLTTSEIVGVTYNYAKWSLSGTHLMLVLGFTIDPNTTIVVNTVLASVVLPQFIRDKIITLWGNSGISMQKFTLIETGGITQDVRIYLSTLNDDTLYIKPYLDNITTNSRVNGRIQFDLIIDDE